MNKTDRKIPLVSVIIPAYNCANVISLAIDSALHQDGIREEFLLEILVIDDGSQDGIDRVMERYKDTPSVHYLKNECNRGAAFTRNRAVRSAKGEYIAFLDGDDYWREGKISAQLKAIAAQGTVLCCSARELMRWDGELTGKIIPVKKQITYRELLKHNSINCSSVVLKRDVALEFPMHHDDSHEDYIMWLEILRKYRKASGIEEPFLVYRMSDKGKSGSKWKSAKMTFQVYRYMGYGIPKAILFFCSYALHGVWKYFFCK